MIRTFICSCRGACTDIPKEFELSAILMRFAGLHRAGPTADSILTGIFLFTSGRGRRPSETHSLKVDDWGLFYIVLNAT
jgi:hypothetical protein